ncbi:hypothetical protein FOXYSP1_07138 [Fusarium oxysporum f. sp. phaseoli]
MSLVSGGVTPYPSGGAMSSDQDSGPGPDIPSWIVQNKGLIEAALRSNVWDPFHS